MGEEERKEVPQHASSSTAPTYFSDEKNARNNESPGKSPKNRDAAIAQAEIEKRLALIQAWEDNEKTKAESKAHKKLSAIDSWESTRRASVEAQLRQIEENFEKKKAEYAEKMKNKAAMVHKAAEEKRAAVEADRGKVVLTVEEVAAKFRVTGTVPKKLFACFSC